MNQWRQVAWSSTKEFIDVFEWLYSNDASKIETAINVVEIWKCRIGQHRIPRAVLSTASLFSAQHQDDVQGLGMAVMRFVATVSGEEQDKNKYDYALPVHSVASRVGIPEWMVSVRHDIAHGMLPKLPMLQGACSYALEWLKENFWKKQLEAYRKISADIEMKVEQVESVLQAYMASSFQCIRNGTNYSDTANHLRPILLDLENLLLQSGVGMRLFELLLQPGYLLPSSDQCIALGLNPSPNETLSPSVIDIPSSFADLWYPLLLLLKRLGLIESLIERSFEALTDGFHCLENTRQAMLICWCQAWLKAFVSNEAKLRNVVSERIYRRIHWSRIFTHVIKNNLCEELHPLSETIIDIHLPRFSGDEKESLKAINRMYLGLNIDTGSENNLTENQTFLQNSQTSQCSTWSKATNHRVSQHVIDWSQYPIGSCPNYSLLNWSDLVFL